MYSEIVAHSVTVDEVRVKNPRAIILSGGPSSVYEEGAPSFDSAIFDLGIPTLGICYGFQIMATALGGQVARTGQREYGATNTSICVAGILLADQPIEQITWMSHGDSTLVALPITLFIYFNIHKI